MELWSRARIATLTFYAACEVHVTILVLAANSALFRFLHSYTLLLQSLFLCALDMYMYMYMYTNKTFDLTTECRYNSQFLVNITVQELIWATLLDVAWVRGYILN